MSIFKMSNAELIPRLACSEVKLTALMDSLVGLSDSLTCIPCSQGVQGRLNDTKRSQRDPTLLSSIWSMRVASIEHIRCADACAAHIHINIASHRGKGPSSPRRLCGLETLQHPDMLTCPTAQSAYTHCARCHLQDAQSTATLNSHAVAGGCKGNSTERIYILWQNILRQCCVQL